MKGKLLIENVGCDDSEFQKEFKHTIVESKNGTKSFRVSGPMIVCETKNKNGRTYKKESMLKEVSKFNELCIKNHLSTRVGMDHPVTAELPLKETAGRILEIYESKTNPNVFCGEVEIFAETPNGATIAALINRGFYPGFSTRALGSIGSEGIVEDVSLISVDLVSDPSAGVYVEQSVYENKTFEYKNGVLLECKETEPKVETKTEAVKESSPEELTEKEKVLLAELETVLSSRTFYSESEIEVSPELETFYDTLIEINGVDKAKNMIEKIMDGRVTVFNEDLKKMNLTPGDKKTVAVLKKLIA